MLEQQLNETRIRKSIEIEEVNTGILWGRLIFYSCV
jgi:hypothetical protein